jgi:hypothetical protein
VPFSRGGRTEEYCDCHRVPPFTAMVASKLPTVSGFLARAEVRVTELPLLHFRWPIILSTRMLPAPSDAKSSGTLRNQIIFALQHDH